MINATTNMEPAGSRWWRHMHACQPSNSNASNASSEDRLISYLQPSLTSLRESLQEDLSFNLIPIKQPNPQWDKFDELASFYQRANKTTFGSITLAPVLLFVHILRLGGRIMVLRHRASGDIVGAIFCLYIAAKSDVDLKSNQPDGGQFGSAKSSEIQDRLQLGNSEAIVYGCTSFLCVDPRLRNLSIGIYLIQESIRYAYDNDVLCGYGLTPEIHTGNSVEIKSWFRPINVDKCRSAGFTFPSYKKATDREDHRDYLAYRVPSFSTSLILTKVTPDNAAELLPSYLELSRSYRFHWSPGLDEWSKWAQQWDLRVLSRGTCAGVILMRTDQIMTPTDTKINIGVVVLGVGSDPDLLKAALEMGKDYDIIYGYLVSSVTQEHLDQIKAKVTTSSVYLTLYNTNLQYQASDLAIPLL